MQTQPLAQPITLSANPEAYDYIHSLRLLASSAIEMIAGDGQKMWFKASGSFQILQQHNSILLRVYDVSLVDPYDDGDLLPMTQDFECKGTIEYGQYLLPDGLPTVQIPERRQYLSFTRRVVFEADPILLASNGGDINNDTAKDATERIYYPMSECRRGTMRELSRPRLILPGQK
ncbi:MAG: hypothetical protein U0930_19040 [Pirellulales bacterium]